MQPAQAALLRLRESRGRRAGVRDSSRAVLGGAQGWGSGERLRGGSGLRGISRAVCRGEPKARTAGGWEQGCPVACPGEPRWNNVEQGGPRPSHSLPAARGGSLRREAEDEAVSPDDPGAEDLAECVIARQRGPVALQLWGHKRSAVSPAPGQSQQEGRSRRTAGPSALAFQPRLGGGGTGRSSRFGLGRGVPTAQGSA